MRVLGFFGKGGGGGGGHHGGGGHGHGHGGGGRTVVVGGGGYYPGYDTAGYLVDDSCVDCRNRVAFLESLLRANNIKF